MKGSVVKATLVVVLLIATHFGATIASANDEAQSRQVEAVALEYAQGFAAMLAGNPAEAARIGITEAGLSNARATASFRVAALDDRFGVASDKRTVDQALVATPLWWVLVAADDGSAVVVAVESPDGQAPRAAGLNWVSARALTSAVSQVDKGSERVVWAVQDLPLVLGTRNGKSVAVPVVDAATARQLRVPTQAQPVDDYTRQLHLRISNRQSIDAGPRDAGELSAGSGAGPAAPTETGGAAGLVVPAGAVLLVLGLAVLMGRSTASRRPGDRRT